MKASGIKALQNFNKQKNVRRNSVFLSVEKVELAADVEHISKEKRQLRNYWSSVDAAIFSISGHGGQQRLKRNIRRKTQYGQRSTSDKGMLLSKEALRSHRLFNPLGKTKLLWDGFIGCLIMYSVVIIPYRIGFEQSVGSYLSGLDTAIDILFFLDICATFNTAVDDPQTDLLIVNREIIAAKYLSFWFWIDAVSTIPFDHVVSSFMSSADAFSSIRLVRLVRLTRLVKLVRVAKLGRLGNRLETFDINPAIFGVQKMIIQIWFVAHLLCCFWHFLATSSGQTTKVNGKINWIKAFDYENDPVGTRYSASFYYIITSMLAIGYGDIYATNTSEMIYAMMVMIIGSILFGAVIAQVNRLIESRNPSLKAFKYRMNELRAYLNEKNLPNVLRTKATAAYRYYLRKKSAFDENDILNDLPTSLLSSLVLTAYGDYSDSIKLFKDLKKIFVVKLIIGFRPFQASVGEYVIKQNDVVEELIFIMKGIVQFSTSADGRETAVTGYSSDGGFFGDFEYYRKTNRFLNYVAMASCNLVATTIKHFDDAMASYPESGQIIQKMMKSRYKNYLTAKASDSYLRGAGVRVKTLLWVDGLVRSGVAEDGDEADPIASHLLSKSQSQGKHVRILLMEDEQEEHMDEQIDRIFKLYYVIPPMLDLKIKWDLLIGVIIVYSIIVIPVQVGFSISSTEGAMYIFEKCVDVMFFFDMAISFRTAYSDDMTDALVVVPEKIYRNYLKSWFVIDFFSTVPFDEIFGLLFDSPSNSLKSIKLLKVSRLLRLLKLARFAKLRKYIAKIEDSLGVSPVAFELGKMIIEVIFISHLTACFYWFACTNMSDSTWYDPLGLRDAELESQYLTTLYWTITTLATVGYGDITPSNQNEQGVTIVVMLLGATVFGYIVSNVSALMGSFDLTAQRLSEKISEVEGYLSEKNVPDSLGIGVVKQIKHTFSQMSAFDEGSILNRLPSHLSRQIVSLKHAEALENIAILRYITNKGTILHIFSMMSPAFYDVDEPLLIQGSLATDIVFITRGKAQITRVTRHVKQISSKERPKLNFKNLLQKHGGLSEVTGRQKPKNFATVAMMAAKSTDPATIKPILESAASVQSMVSSPSLPDQATVRKFGSTKEQSNLSIKNAESKESDIVSELPRIETQAMSRPAPMLHMKLKSLQRISSTRQPLKILQRNRNTRMETITTHLPICKVGPGHFCGHVSLMTCQKIKASVIAVLPCSVFLLSELDITMIVRDLPAVALTLKRAFAHAIIAQRNFAKEKIQYQRSALLSKMRSDFAAVERARKETIQGRVRERYKKIHTALLIRRLAHSSSTISTSSGTIRPGTERQGLAPIRGNSGSEAKPTFRTSMLMAAAAAKAKVEKDAVAAGNGINSNSAAGPTARKSILKKMGSSGSRRIYRNSSNESPSVSRRRRASSESFGGGNSTLRAIKAFSSKISGVAMSSVKVDLTDLRMTLYNSDDEDELDDLAFIKRTMPKKRSISCQLLGDSSVPFKLVNSGRRKRRLSFPSYDLKDWKEDRVLDMMV